MVAILQGSRSEKQGWKLRARYSYVQYKGRLLGRDCGTLFSREEERGPHHQKEYVDNYRIMVEIAKRPLIRNVKDFVKYLIWQAATVQEKELGNGKGGCRHW